MSDPATGSDPAAESEIATESELVSNATSDESHVDDELKENVKEIVKILRSRGPHSKSPELERDFVCDSEFFESTMAEVRPTPERLKKFAAVLSSMFIRNMEGKFRVLGREISAGSWNPAFAEEFRPQTFSISNPQLVSIGSILDTSADQFREYTMSSRAEAYQYGVDPEIYDNSDAWDWKMPAVPGYFRHYFVTRIEGNKCGTIDNYRFLNFRASTRQ
ncbi:hypothetical protein F4777DRAFT_516343 [Nemania sp. FL0916]|nr:hypothetical protein F4777DRAFT_516343 [Nemania sp. FL0916]